MRKLIVLLVLMISYSCSEKPKELIGTWQVNTPYHKAIYSIEEKDGLIVGKVNYYNDNTYIYRATGTDRDIFLHKLKRKDSLYFDAISGATMKSKDLIIQKKNEDTLLISKQIHNKVLKEIWTKKQD